MKQSFKENFHHNHGIKIPEKLYSTDFYNWNRVMVRYCDQSSFTGDVEEVDPVW
jgi:hypothetical protein